jgi:valyl-tRNA synthetase
MVSEIGDTNTVSIVIKRSEILVRLNEDIDYVAEIAKIKGEIEYLIGFLNSVNQKLANEKFVNNAKPDILERERQKQSDTQIKIENLELQRRNYELLLSAGN